MLAWLAAFFKVFLGFVRDEIKRDTKAEDADEIPKTLRARWRKRIDDQLRND